MRLTRFHTKADGHGMIHLHLGVGHPNAEVDLQVAVTHIEPPAQGFSLSRCDCRFFASVLGDRVYARRSRAPLSSSSARA